MIEKISILDIDSISSEIGYFLKENKLQNMKEGRYDLQRGIYVTIESYETQKKEDRKYESHRLFVDIQYMISGMEIVHVCNIDERNIEEKYNRKKDITFYKNTSGTEHYLKEGDCIIFYPEDAHMPCIRVQEDKPEKVKKAVFKVPIQYFIKTRYLVMDVDGTLTNGQLYIGNNGEIMKTFHIKDGCGIHDILPNMKIIPVIITGRNSQILENRCKELGITKVYQGVQDKYKKLEELLKEEGGDLSTVAYIGDDINDLFCMRSVKKAGGLVACPADAVEDVITFADYICIQKGGEGAVREFIDWLKITR